MQYQIGDWLLNTIETSITHLKTNESVKLEPIATELLTLLAENSGQIVTREELFEKIWNGRIISDHAIYRVITKLRKALSPEDKNAYIVTVSKRGYKLVKEVIRNIDKEENTIGSKSPYKNTELSTLTKTNQVYAFASQYKLVLTLGCLFFLAFVVFMLNANNDKSSPYYNVTTPLTTKTGVETNPVYLDNHKLLFTHQIDENNPANVYLKDLTTGLVERITNNNLTEDNLTASKDGKYVAFTRSYKNQCNVILLEKTNNKYQEKNLFECNTLYTEFSDLALTNNGDTLYYIYETAGSHQIFSHLVSTGRKTQVTRLENDEYIGDISLSLSPDNSKLAFVRLPNWKSSTVRVINTKTNQEELLFELNAFIDSIAWSHDSEELYYIQGEKTIHSYTFANNRHQVVLSSLDPDVRKIYSSPFKNSIAIRKNSNVINRGIWKVSNPLVVENGSLSKLIITSNELDLYPSYANKSNRIAFMSFRSGSQQIWIKDQNNKEHRLTNFTDGRKINYLRWSPDDSQILSIGNREIYSVNPDNGNVTVYLNLEKYGQTGYATWASDKKEIYFSSDVSGEMQIHSLNIESGKISQLTKNGGSIAFSSHAPNELYLLKPHQNGLWKTDNNNTETLLFEDIEKESYAGVIIRNNIIYYYSTNESIRYYDILSKNGGDIELDKLPDLHRFSMPNDASSFVFYERNITESSIVLASEKSIAFIPK